MSKPEDYIAQLLYNSHIKYEREKNFNDLKKGKFRFDFYLPNGGSPKIIEYDGEQHFFFVSKFYKQNSDFLKVKEHDRRKNSYCLANKIPIYRIPFWKIKSITSVSDLFADEFLVKTRWHNDYLMPPKK